jgi:hypothetical protein
VASAGTTTLNVEVLIPYAEGATDNRRNISLHRALASSLLPATYPPGFQITAVSDKDARSRTAIILPITVFAIRVVASGVIGKDCDD